MTPTHPQTFPDTHSWATIPILAAGPRYRLSIPNITSSIKPPPPQILTQSSGPDYNLTRHTLQSGLGT